ncbi:hypothetical protein J6S88_02465 [bacterium]|nr:hypothetical protein [bacterium]
MTDSTGMTQVLGSKPSVTNMGERIFVTTSSGQVAVVPGTMIGSTTTVKILKDGTYAITTKGSRLGAEPETKILTEDELIAKYGPKTGRNIQLVG